MLLLLVTVTFTKAAAFKENGVYRPKMNFKSIVLIITFQGHHECFFNR